MLRLFLRIKKMDSRSVDVPTLATFALLFYIASERYLREHAVFGTARSVTEERQSSNSAFTTRRPSPPPPSPDSSPSTTTSRDTSPSMPPLIYGGAIRRPRLHAVRVNRSASPPSSKLVPACLELPESWIRTRFIMSTESLVNFMDLGHIPPSGVIGATFLAYPESCLQFEGPLILVRSSWP